MPRGAMLHIIVYFPEMWGDVGISFNRFLNLKGDMITFDKFLVFQPQIPKYNIQNFGFCTFGSWLNPLGSESSAKFGVWVTAH